MGFFTSDSELEFKEFVKLQYKDKDEVEEVLEMYTYLRGKHSKEFENDLLELIEKVIKRNKN